MLLKLLALAYRRRDIAMQDYPINNNPLLLKLLALAVQFASKLALRSLNRNFRLSARGIFSLYLTTPTDCNPRGVTTPHCA